MKVALIGGSGFIGTHITNAVYKEWEITVLDTKIPKHEHGNWMYFDIRKTNGLFELFETQDVVINLACHQLDVSDYDPILNAEVNIMGTLKLLTILRKLGDKAPALVHFSTGSVYQLNKLANHYMISKHTSDYYTQLYIKKYDLKGTIIRPFQVFGKDGHGITNKFINQSLNNIPYSIHGDGTQLVTPTHIADVIAITTRVIDLGVWQEIFTITGTQTISVNILADIIDNVTERDNKRKYIKQPNYYKELQFIIAPKYHNELMVKLNWEPPFNLFHRLKQTIEACKI